MKYISTRGHSAAIPFEEALVSGLSPDGGLYMPETFPHFNINEIKSWKNLPYQELVEKIISPFVDNDIPAEELRTIIAESYREFRSEEIAPIKELSDNLYLLELFHGPTLAFKDFALQLLGRLLDYVLTKKNKDIVIIGATSGDTGSAAIEGCKNSEHIKIFMLYPNGKVSDVQRKQMTSATEDNVFNLAVDGTFDDCQNSVKAMFQNKEFSNGKHLVAVNSINWARIMAQIVYYFSTYLKLGAPKEISFSVPTGNFGDVFAGYVAKKMGLPIKELIVATNTNDILHRFFQDNDYSIGEVSQTISPSMDIQISSNFERLLFDLYDGDVSQIMQEFQQSGKLKVTDDILEKAKSVFSSYRVNIDDTLESIGKTYKETGEIIDPHTAIGVAAARDYNTSDDCPIVALATAHPAKFPDAIKNAGVPEAEQPECLKKVINRDERFQAIDNDLEQMMAYINSKV